jgi:hypothetical protein
MRTAVSTQLRPARPAGPFAVLSPLLALGAPALVIDATLPDELAEALCDSTKRTEVTVLAREVAARARLCALDRAERQAATERISDLLRRSGAAGIGLYLVELGSTDQKWDPGQVALRFARGEWQPDDALLEDRGALAPRHLDGARFSLERLLATAEREAVALAILPRRAPPALPDAAELGRLLAEFRGAPLGYWHHSGRTHAEQALALSTPEAWLAAAGERTLGAHAADACGLLQPLPAGTGEVDFGPLAQLPVATLVAPPETPAAELSSALALLRAL